MNDTNIEQNCNDEYKNEKDRIYFSNKTFILNWIYVIELD